MAFKLSTTSVQEVIRQNVKGPKNTACLVARSDFTNPQLRAAVAGHLINGVGLCPSAIYADMAMTLSHYSYKVFRPSAENISMNVRNMTTSSPLIVDLSRTSAEPQTLEIEAKINLSHGSSEVVIKSKNSEKAIEYARCLVAFESDSD